MAFSGIMASGTKSISSYSNKFFSLDYQGNLGPYRAEQMPSKMAKAITLTTKFFKKFTIKTNLDKLISQQPYSGVYYVLLFSRYAFSLTRLYF